MISEIRKIEIASDILNTLANRGIPIEDRQAILNLAIKSLNGKKRRYNRRKKK